MTAAPRRGMPAWIKKAQAEGRIGIVRVQGTTPDDDAYLDDLMARVPEFAQAIAQAIAAPAPKAKQTRRK
jgi:hypothetical protein